jgi:hypothetical protein
MAIVEVILSAKRSHSDLDVRLFLDAQEALAAENKKQGGLIRRIVQAGGTVRYIADADKAHSKFVVIDAEVVITGSFNFKRHAGRVQRDNIVVIRGRDAARAYISSFAEALTSKRASDAQRHTDAPQPPQRTGSTERGCPSAETAALARARTPARGRGVGGPRWAFIAQAAAILVLVGMMTSNGGARVPDADAAFAFSGTVEAMPPDGFVGTWQVGGRAVQVTHATKIERTSFSPAIGEWVTVEGSVLSDESVAASEIELGEDD